MTANGVRSGPIPERWLLELPHQRPESIRLARGQGTLVWDDEDRQYLDLMNGDVALLGHAHPEVTAAVVEQAGRLTGAGRGVELDSRDELIEALSVLVPAPLSHVALAPSSAEALRRGVRLAKHVTGRARVLATAGIDRLIDGAEAVAHGDLAGVERLMNKNVAALVVEPIRAADGDVRVPAPGYLAVLAGVARRARALLIVDETRTALRTGSQLTCITERVFPDILCLGDGLANGLPIGVTITRSTVAEAAGDEVLEDDAACGPLACAAAAVTLRIACDPAFQARVGMVGDHFLARLNGLRLPEIRATRGRGLLLLIEVRANARALVAGLRERGILTPQSCEQRIRIQPPLILTRREADIAVEAVAATVLALRRPRTQSSPDAATTESHPAERIA